MVKVGYRKHTMKKIIIKILIITIGWLILFLLPIESAQSKKDRIGILVRHEALNNDDKIIKGFEGEKLVVVGTGDSQELLRTLAKALETKLKGCEINIPDSIGSSGGIQSVISGKYKLARVARPLTQEEVKRGLIYKQFAKSPVVFAVHSSVGSIDNITTDEILGIYSGKITDWSQVDATSKGKIYSITRESGDSCLKIINNNIPGFQDIIKPVAKIIYSTPNTVSSLIRYKGTIGFLPLSMAIDKNLRILKVDGVYPSVENVLNGKYKLVVPLGIVYKEEPVKLVRKFIDFLYSEESKRIITEKGAVPAQ